MTAHRSLVPSHLRHKPEIVVVAVVDEDRLYVMNAEISGWLASAMIMRWLTAAAIVVTAALVGLAAWILGLAGLANRAESICFADLDNRLGYGAYQVSREVWSLSFECRLLGNSVDPIDVQHPFEAIVTFGWVVVVPALYTIAVLVLTLRWARQAGGRHDV